MEPSLKAIAKLEQWKFNNEDVLPYMSFRFPQHPQESQEEIRNFYKNRSSAHEQIVNQLIHIKKNIHTEFAKILSKMKFEIRLFPKFSRIFEDQSSNFEARKLLYLNKKLKKMVGQYYEGLQPYINEKLRYSEMMTSLFSQNIVPKECIVSVYPEFFNLDYQTKLLFKIQLINAFGKNMVVKLASVPKPLWINDFHSFFFKLIDEGLQILNDELFYFQSLPGEVSLTRYFFATHSREGHAIDLFIAQSANANFKDFTKRVVVFLMAMIKELKIATDKQSVALLMIYRILMDRIYETNTQYFEASTDVDPIIPISTYPISSFTMPMNMVKISDPNESIRNCFLRDQNYTSAAHIMNFAIFSTNPIDVLYHIHNAMVMIHKAAITNLNNKTPTEEDLKHLLGFDDLFSLLLGTTLASDIPDIQEIGRLMKIFVPYDCMSPQLEYANSNLEAIVLYLTSPSS